MEEKEPDYVAKFTAADPLITRIGIERSILRAWKSEWSKKKSPYGYTFTYHFCQYLKLVCPNTDLHAFTVRLIKGFEKTAFIKSRKIMNMIGSKNSGKTDFCATFALAMLSIWPEYTTVYVAAPYMSAADSTVWGRILTRMKQMKKANPKMWAGVYEYKAKNRVVFEKHAESGFCELRTLDKIGKLQGTKSLDAEKGWLFLFCDEIALFPTRALLDLLDNLSGNDNFFCFTGCNFKNTEGLEGDLCRPFKREYSELDLDEDQEWESAYKSYTIRLDGHQSPNVVAGKVLYKYLLREDQRQDAQEIHGLMGPKYLEQIRSFPNNSMSDFFVTSREKIRAGGGWDDFVFDKGQAVRVSFCDPGFGGDPCKIGVFEYSNARVQDSEGNFHTVPLFMPLATMETIKVMTSKIADQNWIDRLHHQSDGAMFLREGQEITMENQIAVQAGEFLQKWGVQRSHFGFDGSMRAGIVQEMISVLGSSIAAVDFGGKPTKRIGDLTGKKEANELYFNFVSEMYFNFAKLVQSGQFRNANLIPAGIAQICRRQWKWRGNLKQIEPKAEYKVANQGRSPDDADTLIGALEIALRKGFMETARNRPEGIGGSSKIAELINQSPRFRKRTAQKLHS